MPYPGSKEEGSQYLDSTPSPTDPDPSDSVPMGLGDSGMSDSELGLSTS